MRVQKFFVSIALLPIILLLSLASPTRSNAQSAACPTPRLAIGNTAVVEFKPFVELRSEPNAGQLLAKIKWYVAIGGPICTSTGSLWWKVQTESGAVGYAPEGSSTAYWVYAIPTKVPVNTQGAFQAFENGYMLWRSDSGGIMVFIGKNGGVKFTEYHNRSYARLRNNPVVANPPAGLFKPINGFGKLWGNTPSLRQQLGWAVGEEQTYSMTISYPDPTQPTEYYTLPNGHSIYTHWHLVLYWGIQ